MAFSYPPGISLEDLRSRIAQASTAHPRLFARDAEFAALKRRVEAQPLHAALAKSLILEAEALLNQPPIERTLQGRRLLEQSRRAVKRTLTLAMAWRLTGREEFAARCRDEMLAAAAFADWNPSHFLDVGEMTFALAVGYDWLHGWLDPGSCHAIREAILEKGLRTSQKHTGWVRAKNNWGQVCHGGIVAGALATMEDEPELAAELVHRALNNVTESMDAFAPNGSYPEGPGYWSYGTTYNVILIAVLQSALGDDFGLSAAPGFDRTGDYINFATGPSGLTFNYADGGSGRSVEPAVFWLASRFGRPDWALYDNALLQQDLKKTDGRGAGGSGGRFMPLALLWLVEEGAPAAALDAPLGYNAEGRVPVAILRSSWTDPGALYIGLKAGSPSANHGNMDAGSFVFDALGERWAIDLGSEPYNGIEQRGMNLWSSKQDSDRWTIFRQSNLGHNTLVIDGQLQKAAGFAPITAFSAAPEYAHAVADLSDIYSDQAAKAERGVALVDGRMALIQDRLSGLKPGAVVRWGMITKAEAQLEADSAVLSQNKKRLDLRIARPDGAEWKLFETAKPPKEWDSPNPGTRMVGFEAKAPASGELEILVLLTPASETPQDLPSALERLPLP